MKEEADPLGQAVHDFIDGLEGKAPIGEATIAGDQELTNEQRSRLPYVMAIYHDCYLCGAPPPPAGMYTWKLGDQTIITPICGECKTIVAVKDMILGELRKRVRNGE